VASTSLDASGAPTDESVGTAQHALPHATYPDPQDAAEFFWPPHPNGATSQNATSAEATSSLSHDRRFGVRHACDDVGVTAKRLHGDDMVS
jgi:hypothetical protein